MNIDYFLSIITMLVSIVAVFGENRNQQTKKITVIGFVVMVFAIVLAVGSIYKAQKDEEEKKLKSDEVKQLQAIVENSRDTINRLKSLLIPAIPNIEAGVKDVPKEIHRQELKLTGKNDTIFINKILKKGMEIVLNDCNCGTYLSFNQNNSNSRYITLGEDKSAKFLIQQDDRHNKSSYFCLASDKPCGGTLRVFSTNTIDSRTVEAETLIENVKRISTANIQQIDFSGKWKIIFRYGKCREGSKFSNRLETYYDLAFFDYNTKLHFSGEGTKTGEKFDEHYTKQTQNEVQITEGQFSNGQIFLKFNEKYIIKSKQRNDIGEISLNQIITKNNKIILKGTFYKSDIDCIGEAVFEKN